MKIKTLKLITGKHYLNQEAERLRGYIGNYYKDDLKLHNHLSEFQFNYQTPCIQYKTIDKTLAIVGLGSEGDKSLEALKNLKEVILGEEKVKIHEIIEEEIEYLPLKDDLYNYKFIHPWLALNEKNYKKYKNNKADLNKILIGNILEFFSLERIFIKDKLMVKGNFKEKTINRRGTKLISFEGSFVTNIKLPDYIGLGKRKSIGFGTIKEV